MMARPLFAFMLAGLTACAAVPESGGSGKPPASPARASVAAAPQASLVGTRWVGVNGGSDARTTPRLEFIDDGRVTGYTGCNMLNGTWRMEGGEVRFGPIATTKRMCAGDEGEMEKRVLAVLVSGSRVSREGSRLVLTAPGGARFEFNQAAAG